MCSRSLDVVANGLQAPRVFRQIGLIRSQCRRAVSVGITCSPRRNKRNQLIPLISNIRKFGIPKIYACRTLVNPEGFAIYRLTGYRYFARVLSAHAFRNLRYFTQTIATDHTIFVIVYRASFHKTSDGHTSLSTPALWITVV